MRSWDRSVRSTKDMICYVRYLRPHSLERVKEIYIAEHMIGVLSESILCFSEHVGDLKQTKKEAEDLKEDISKISADYAQDNFTEELSVLQDRVSKVITVYEYDKSVIEEIVDTNGALQEITSIISDCEEGVAMCEDETKQILRTCAELNTFIGKHALMEHDDELSGRLQNQMHTFTTAKYRDTATMCKN